VKVKPTSNIRYLFTTKTCPNCVAAKRILGDESYVQIDAEENAELVEKYGVMQAPTLVVVENNRAKKYVNASNIKKYVERK
jgi:glutaredoxin